MCKVCIQEAPDRDDRNADTSSLRSDRNSVRSDMPSEKTPLLDISSISTKSRKVPPRLASFGKMWGSTMSTVSTSVRHLKKSVGFLQGFSLIVGILIGSGVFISPSLVMSHTGGQATYWKKHLINCSFLFLSGTLIFTLIIQ